MPDNLEQRIHEAISNPKNLGEMQDADYALQVFHKHLAASGFGARSGTIGLEMGPGDSVGSAIVAKALGSSRFILVDAGDYANRDVETYRNLSRACMRDGPAMPDIERAASFEDVLTMCGASYLTRGLQSYRELPAASVDLIFSQAVLEHVRRHEFAEVAAQMYRILKPGGIASHQVDLRDHLGGGLNNMRISSRWWETELMAGSGFYTNRIRFSEMLNLFEQAGFMVEVVSTHRWDDPPISRKKLAPEFRHFTGEDLLVSSFHVLLRRRAD